MERLLYNRKTKQYEKSTETQDNIINFLYNTRLGKILLVIVFSKRWFSNLVSLYYKSRFSRRKIYSFVKENNIDIKYINKQLDEFKSFNDFFSRKEIRESQLAIQNLDREAFISPAQSKLIIHKVTGTLKISVKGYEYTVSEILDSNKAEIFKDGYCLIFRLSTTDYHRYLHIDTGSLLYEQKVKGTLHTVRDEGHRYKVFVENSRVISLWDTTYFGRIGIVEVGALTIGKIKNNQTTKAIKGIEKGYFEYGGSTIVVFVEPNKVTFDVDILEQSKNGIETIVDIGEQIGKVYDIR